MSARTLTAAVEWDGSVGRMGGWAMGTLGLAAFWALGAAASVMIGWLEGWKCNVGRLGDLVLFHNSLFSRL